MRADRSCYPEPEVLEMSKLAEGPNSFHAVTPPSAKELAAPTKVYPGASKLGHDRTKDLISGPCDDAKGPYHK